ncbi:unnamed protein product, partial [Rotaria magnacalcarata]
LHVNVVHFTDCIYLLDGRFNKLRILHVNIHWIAHSTLIIDDMENLPNLECFSRHYLVLTSDYDELIVRLLHRILNLVTLSLYITVYFKSTFIDGNDLKKNVSNVISCLERNNSYWIYRLNRLLSSCQSKNGENLFSSSMALSSTMKKLFDSKQYKEALNLFDQNFEISTDSTINMAIKACTISKDYKRGIRIQQRLSSKSRNNSYIQAALLCFYRKSFTNAFKI